MSPVQITDARTPRQPLEIAALATAAVLATPGLPDEERIRLIRRILAAAGVP